MSNASRSSAITQLLGLSCVLILASCDTTDPSVESGTASVEATAEVDTGIVTADAGQGAMLPDPGWSIEEGLTVELEFTGQYNAVTGELEFDFDDASVPVSENGLRTAGQALWCQDRITVVQDGVAGSNPPNTFEISSGSIGTYAACDPSTFPDGTPSGLSYANLVDTDGALCSSITIRSFYPFAFQDVHAWIYEVNPIDNYAYTWGDRVIDGLGNGAEPPTGANAPSDNRGGLFYYGNVDARDPVGPDNAVTRPWVFRYPIDGANFNFRGKLVARFTETCNSIDDDCDGRIDEGANCYPSGSVCVDSTDCAATPLGAPVSCVASGSGTGTTCGGGILQENCSGTVDTNGDGRVGCLDPTCSGVGSCADSSCVQSNAGNDVSSFEGDPVATAAVTATSFGTFSLPAGQERCASRFEGAERTWIWTAPANGSYTFSTVGSTYDTALMVVRGECPVDLVAAFNAGTAFCSEGSVVGTQAEEVTLSMVAGETALVIVDSSYAPSLTIGRGNASLSIFKSAVCGDNYRDAQNRFGAAVEACDAGPVSTAACDADCTAVACGDGFNNLAVEGCEDGNLVAGDGCTPTCTIEPGFSCPGGADCVAVCGDGIVAGPEVCDDSNVVNTDGCSSDCRTQDSRWSCVPGACTPICGDGVTAGPEVCDSSGGIGCESCLLVTPGYRCPAAGGACSDIDECGEGIDACSIFGLCENLPGTYACSCDTGFSGDGFICSDINECLTNNGGCDVNAACANNDGGRVCTCNSGWSGSGTTCSDVDECLTNNGGCDALTTCSNSAGSFSCGACPAGYNGTGATSCTPNVCSTPLTPAFASRTDTATSYPLGTVIQLACNPGYEATGGNTSRTCSATSTVGPAVAFSGSDVVCSRIACDPVPALSNGTVTGSGTGLLYGDTASYTCNSGYELTGGTLDITCGTDGSWSSPSGACTPRDCGALTAPSNGSVAAAVTTFGATATYSCNTGYTLTGDSSRTCAADANWTGAAPTCDIVTCPSPAGPTGSVLTGGPYTFTYNETVTFGCQTGRTATGPIERTCQADGTYSTSPNTCPLVDCGTLAAPANGTISPGATTYNTERTLGCDTGYNVSGSTSRTCQANGQWSGTTTVCTINDCGAPPVPVNGTVSATTGNTFGSTVTYSCNSGYTGAAATPALTCGAAGWEGTVPTCVRVTCPSVTSGPEAPANASIAAGGSGPHVFEDVVTFACNTGFELTAGDATRTCQANATWTGTRPTCTAITCTDPGVPVGGFIVAGSATGPAPFAFGDVINYDCDDDRTPVGSQTLTCGTGTAPNGRWDFPRPTCAANDCGPLPVVANSTLSPASPDTTSGSSVTYTCNSGYTQTAGNLSRTCNGTTRLWSGTSPVCSPVSCGSRTTPEGQVLTGGPYSNVFGETLTYSCAPGWELPSGATTADLSSACQAAGTWATPAAACQRVSCGSLSAPTNGSQSGSGTTFESVRTFSCSSGYVLSGSASRTCQADGQWSGTAAVCSPVDCGALTNPSQGSVSAPVTTLSNTATYSCNPGYLLTGNSGSATRTCQASGSWSGTAPTCEPRDCGALSGPANGSVAAPTTTYSSAPTTATYACNTGYNLVGSATRTCQTTGTWSGAAPTCAIADCNAPSAVLNGAVSAPTTTFGATATHSCSSGYAVRAGTSTSQTCSAAGTWSWSGSPLVCDIQDCGTPPAIANDSGTSPSFTTTTFGSSATYTCASGYELAGSATIQCNASGASVVWATAPACNPVSCGTAPATVTNGTRTSATGTTFGQTATYTCNAGFDNDGVPGGSATATLTCQAGGTWGSQAGSCVQISCGTAPAIGANNTAPAGTYNAGQTATYTCSTGFSIDGGNTSAQTFTRTCNASTGWSTPADSTCDAFQCPLVSNIVDAPSGLNAAVVSYPDTTRLYNQRLQYTRQEGFTQTGGDSLRTCGANGQWSGTAPTFSRMSCPLIPTPASPSQLTVTYRNPSNVVTSDRFVNHTASFGCGSGFSPSPATVQTCRETSATSVQWQTTPGVAASNPVCADVNECTSGSPPNCGSNATCNNTSGSYQCVCNTASGWVGTTTTGGPATCVTDCGDGIQAGAEVCDDGVWNDRPAAGQLNPATSHPRYGATDCEGRACDCTTNSFPAGNYPGCTPRTVCREASGVECTSVNPVTPGRCSDGVSNDGDGLIDCFDPECSDKANCPNWSSSTCAIQNYLGSRINTPSTTAIGTYNLALTDPNNWNVATSGVLRGSTDEAFAWQAPLTGTYRFNTCGATFDSVIGVFSGVRCSETANPPTHLASNDDTCGDDAQVDVAVTKGQWYTIVVTGYNAGETGNFPLNITAVTAQVCGDNVVNGFTSVGVNDAVRIPNSRMTGSANFAGGEPWRGRLNGTAAFASSAGCNESSWLQVDLGGPSPTEGIITQGNGNASFNEYVTSYRVRYSNDAVNWTEVGGTTANTGTLFQGNRDRATARVNKWAPITARYWRVHPISCFNGGTPAMRIDLIGSLEECDDGNAIDTDTCSNSCRINSDPFPTCAPTVQTNVVNQLGPTGSTGTPNLVSGCPAGMVAAGLYGRADVPFAGALWVSRFGARCAPLVVGSGSPATVSRPASLYGINYPIDGASLGRTTGTNSAQDCPAGQFLIGVNFKSGGVIDSYQGICGSFTYSNGNRTITRTTNGTTATIGGSGGGAVQYLCPDNQVVTSVNAGTDGSWVTRAGITCAPIQPIFFNAGGGGGGDFSSTCPEGTVAIGLDGQGASSYIYQLRTICAPMPVLNTATTPDSWSLARGQGLYYANNVGTSTGTAYNLQCPAGQYVIGINANTGSRVDFMNAICGTFSLSGGTITRTQNGNTANTNTGGGGTTTMICPGNGVVSAIRGRNGGWLDAVGIQCTQVTPACDATPSFGYDAFALSGINQFLSDNTTRTYTSRVPYCPQVQRVWTSLGFSPAHTYSADVDTAISNTTYGVGYTLWADLFGSNDWFTRTESWIFPQLVPGLATWVFSVADDASGDTGTISSLNVNFLCRP